MLGLPSGPPKGAEQVDLGPDEAWTGGGTSSGIVSDSLGRTESDWDTGGFGRGCQWRGLTGKVSAGVDHNQS